MTLDIISPKLRFFSVGANIAIMDSEVDVPEDEQEGLAAYDLDQETRRLQGQPDKIFNINAVWDNTDWGTQVAVFYNFTGELLVSGASRGSTDGNPDVFESPFGTMNVTVSQKLQKGFTVTFKAGNLNTDNRQQVWRVPSGEDTIKVQRETSATYQIGVKFTH